MIWKPGEYKQGRHEDTETDQSLTTSSPLSAYRVAHETEELVGATQLLGHNVLTQTNHEQRNQVDGDDEGQVVGHLRFARPGFSEMGKHILIHNV